MQPENQVWAEYESRFKKRLGIGGAVIGKLLTGTKDGISIFFIETDEGLVPYFESDQLPPEELRHRAELLLAQIREGYLGHTVEAVREWIADSGSHVSISEERSGAFTSFVLTIGTGEKKLRITMDKEGRIEERVDGVLGRSCSDLTTLVEQRLSVSSHLNRVWTHEYDVTIEDKQIQILRLT
ncbi:DUF2997 domain-containing protein [Brevibacillus reuszeri]|uniref:DUF2997 domain-containing protein n=1 Tax=Brevibacillus reuszeri TaxID=54915 RepID=UPI0013DFDBCB|nr:DUF2997 domain-containing protein [Brevibacillus reuszeri]